jgi:carbohydrate kinase (thermoresistant glucokinase family)
MAGGTPLEDADRWPWLDRVGAALADGLPPVVAACSALRRPYRDRLRATVPDVVMLHLLGEADLIEERLRARQGHFMPTTLLGSQFATLESLGPDERAVAVSVERPVPEVVAALLDGIARV